MSSFKFISPHKIIFGQGKIKEVGYAARDYGKKAFLVTGRRAIRETGILENVTRLLSASNVEITLFDQVPPEPSIDVVDNGVALCLKEECDLVIGLGGGSALDVAKACAYMVKRPGLPFIAIPTTAGTGSEASFNSVLIYPDEKIKKSIRDPQMIAKVAIVDPELTLSCPRDVTIHSGLDALVHLIEGYVSKGANPLTDPLALSGLRLIHEALKKVVSKPNDITAREKMSLAALMGGIVLANAGLGAVHGLASPIGGRVNAPHGLVCAILLPWIMEYNIDAAPEKFGQIANVLDSDDAIVAIQGLLEDLGISPRLGPLGIEEDQIPAIIRDASSSIQFNPRETDEGSLIKLLKEAL